MDLAKSIQDNAAGDKGPIDKLVAIGSGLGGATGLYGLYKNLPSAKAASWCLGVVFADFGLGVNFGREIGALSTIIRASMTGNDPAKLQAAYAVLQSSARDAAFQAAQLDLTFAAPEAGAFGIPLIDGIRRGSGGQAGLQATSFLTNVYDMATAGKFAQLQKTALSAGSEVTKVFISNTEGIAEAVGAVNVSNSQGKVLAAESGIELSPFDVQMSQMTALSDPSGHYDFFVTLQAPNTNYANLMLRVFDPVSGLILDSATVNLSGLNTSALLQLPSLQGTCSDTDASSPDADDPDCD